MLDKIAINQIKKTLRKSVDSNYIAGGNLMIIKNGKEIFYYEDGFADIEAGIPIKRDSIFRLYSISKPITAVSIMMLLERGEIDLFEPVSKYLPGFKNPMIADAGGNLVPASREVEIKDLLSMTSGLCYGGEHKAGRATWDLLGEIDSRMFGDSPMGTVEAMNKLGECPLMFNPGTLWEYGLSADVLGAIVEVVSGMSFGEFLKKELFEPLGMKDTGFYVPNGKKHRLVKVYEEDGDGKLSIYNGNNLCIINKMDRKPAFESGGAGMVSTIDDYAKFTQMLMKEGNLGGVQILRPKTVEFLRTGALTAEQQKGFDTWRTLSGYTYGNLMRVLTDCNKAGAIGTSGLYGWDGWLGTYFCNCPKDDLTFLFMMQKTNTGMCDLTRKLLNIVISSCCE